MPISIHRWLLSGVLALCSFGAIAQPQPSWPQKAIRIIVPFAPGGTSDTVSRRLAMELTRQLGQTVYVENRAGAMGTIGMSEAAKSRPDGYTLVANDTGVTMLPHIQKKLPYDLDKDFVPIGAGVFSPFGLIVNADSRFQSLQDLVKQGRAKPDSLSYGSGGIGTSPHLAAESFAQAAGLKLTHVPFKGAGEAIIAVASKVIDMQLVTPSTAMANIKGGKLKMLAISGDQRLSDLPDVPTFAEAGLPDYEVWNWIGLWAPAGTPAAIVERLRAEVGQALKSPGMQAFARDISAQPKVVVGPTFAQLVKDTDHKWKALIDTLDLSDQ